MRTCIVALCILSAFFVSAQPMPSATFKSGAFYYYCPNDTGYAPVRMMGFNGVTVSNFRAWGMDTGNLRIDSRYVDSRYDGKKWALFDMDCRPLCGYEYEHLFPFKPINQNNNYTPAWFMACKNGKWGLLSRSGKELIPCQYDLAPADEANGDCFYTQPNRPCTGADLENNVDCYHVMFEDGVFTFPMLKGSVVLMQKGKFGLVDTLGNVRIPFVYDAMVYYYGGLIELTKGKKKSWGTRYGKILEGYSQIKVSNCGVHNVKKDEKWGYINNKGEEIVPCQFTEDSDMGRDHQSGNCTGSAPAGDVWWNIVVSKDGEVKMNKVE